MSEASRQVPPRLRFAVAAEPSRLLRARDRVRDYLARHCSDQTTVDDVVLAVEEACTNAIRHSGSQEEIEIRLGFEGDRLLAAVRDRGHGFDIGGFDPDLLPDVSSDHGRGLFLIARLCDEMELRYIGGLEVVMVKQGVSFCEAAPLESGLGDVGAGGPVTHREARTRALLEDIDEGFVALDWEYRYVHANQMALTILGLPREELLGRRPWDIWPTLTGTPAANAIREAMELGKPSVLESRAAATGTWLEERFYPTAAGVSAYLREIDDRKRIEREVVASRAELATTLAAITDGFYTLDRAWRVTYLNDRAATLFPGAGDQVLGADFWELFPEAVGSDVEANKRRAMEHGEFRSFEYYHPPLDAWFEERDYPSEDGITVLFTDISVRKRAEAERDRLLQTTSLLLEAATAGTARTDLDQLLESLGDLLLRSTDHSRILLELWDEERREVEIAVSAGAAATRKQRFAFDDISDGARRAITTRETVVVDYASTAMPGSQEAYVDEHAFLLALVVPIVYRERLIGLVTLDEPGQRRAFSPQEVQVVEAIAGQAGAAIQNARLYEAQLHIATILQENLVHPLPTIAGLELATVSLPAGRQELVGGDFCDVIARPDGVVVALIGDVTGKGIEAAGFTETVRAAVRTLALISPSPQYILGNVNRLLLHEGEHRQLATALLVTIDPCSGQGFVASAGHPPPVQLCKTGCRVVEPVYGLPLGVLDWGYEATGLALAPGEALVLYTDGLTEARRDGELFGEKRLLETVETLGALEVRDALQLIERLKQAVIDYADELRDDLEMLVLRRTK